MSKKKQELKRNELASALEEKLEALKPYSNAIMIGGGVVLLLIVGIGYWFYKRSADKAERWQDFFYAQNASVDGNRAEDLLSHADEYETKDSALWARKLAADQKLGAGSRKLIRDRTYGVNGREEDADIIEAIELYDEVLDHADTGTMLYELAMLGRAQAHEAALHLDKARDDYEAVLKSAGEDSALGIAVVRRLQILDLASEQFVVAFREFDPADSVVLDPSSTALDTQLPFIPDLSYPETATSPNNQGTGDGLIQPNTDPNGNTGLDPLVDPNAQGDANTGDQNSGDDTTGDDTTGDDTTGDDTTGDDTGGDDTTGDDTGGDDTGGDDTGGDDTTGGGDRTNDQNGTGDNTGGNGNSGNQ